MTTFKTHLLSVALAFCATVVHAQLSGGPAATGAQDKAFGGGAPPQAGRRVASILAGDPTAKKDDAARSAIQRIELGTPRLIFAPDGSISNIHTQVATPRKRNDTARTIHEPGTATLPTIPGNHIERTTPEKPGDSVPVIRKQLQRHVAYYDEPKNTAIKEEGFMFDQTPVRDWKLYFKNGNVEQEGSYDMRGRKHGIWKVYSSDGSLKETQTYVDGKLTAPPAETTPPPGN